MKNKWQIGLLILILLLVISGCSNTNDYVSSKDDASDNDDLAQENEVVSEVKVDDGSNQFDSSQYFDPQNIDASTLSTKYNIIADLDEENNVLKSDITIEYTNMTDDKLNDIQLIFPMKCLADNRTGLDFFDGTMNQERFEVIDFKIESIKIDGEEWAVDYTDSNLWKGSHHDLLNLPLDEGLDINDTSEIEIIYEYSLPLSDVLGVRDNKYAFSAWYPMIPFYQEGAWQGDYSHDTWTYHVPYASVTLDVTWDTPKTFLTAYDWDDTLEPITEYKRESIIDRHLAFYLINNMTVKREQIDKMKLTYIYPVGESLDIDQNDIERYIKQLDSDKKGQKIEYLVIFMTLDGIRDNNWDMINFNLKEEDMGNVQTAIREGLTVFLLTPTYIGNSEKDDMVRSVVYEYRMLDWRSFDDETTLHRLWNERVESYVDHRDLKLVSSEALINIASEEEYDEESFYKPTFMMVELGRKVGHDKVMNMLKSLDKEYMGKSLSFDEYIDFIKMKFGEEADSILEKYID